MNIHFIRNLAQGAKIAKERINKIYPKHYNLQFGDNNICYGYWFNLPNKSVRKFYPIGYMKL